MGKTKEEKSKLNKNRDQKVKRQLQIKGIRGKLIIYILALIILLFLIGGTVFTIYLKNTFIEIEEEDLVSSATKSAKLMESEIGTQIRTLEMIASRDDIQDMNWEMQKPILESQLSKTDFLTMAIVDREENVRFIDGSTGKLADGKEHVRNALDGQAGISSGLELSHIIDENVMVFTVPIEKDDEVVGALIGHRDANTFSKLSNNVTYGESGYGYVINKDGVVIGHPNKDWVLNEFNPIQEGKDDKELESLSNLFETILEENLGTSEYTFEGESFYAGYGPIGNSDAIFVVTANSNDVLSNLPTLLKYTILTLIIILLLIAVIVYFIGSSVTKPIMNVVRISERIAELDLTEEIPEKDLKRTDEVGDLAKSFKTIINNLRNIIDEINDSSKEVASSSEELTATSEESASTAQEVNRAVEEVSKGAEEQAFDVQEGASKTRVLGDNIEKNKQFIDALIYSSNNVNKAISDGLEDIDNLSQITEESGQSIEEIHQVILETHDSSKEISEASNVIASIAEQTNLLALNAAIEAARAGEAGRGFAVVAEEIKELAEQSSISTETIDEIVNELQNNSQDVVSTMDRVSDITKEQMESVKSNKENYDEIGEAMKYTMNIIERLSKSEDNMDSMKDEILATMEDLTAIAEENAASTEEASVSMEEQSTSIEEIAKASEGLAHLSENLQSIIEKFKI